MGFIALAVGALFLFLWVTIRVAKRLSREGGRGGGGGSAEQDAGDRVPRRPTPMALVGSAEEPLPPHDEQL